MFRAETTTVEAWKRQCVASAAEARQRGLVVVAEWGARLGREREWQFVWTGLQGTGGLEPAR